MIYNNFILENSSIKKAILLLNSRKIKTLIVIDKNKKLLGSITDGDLRRGMLKKNSINSPIKKIYNKNTIYINNKEKLKSKEILNIFKKNNISIIPVINNSKKIIKIIDIEHYENKKVIDKKFKKIKIPVCIMAGGKGSRLKPFSVILPKPLIPFKGKTVIENIISNLENYKINDIFVSINFKKEIIRTYIKEVLPKNKIKFIEENVFLGTCGSLSYFKNKNIKSCLTINCDTLLNIQYDDLINYHEKFNYDLTLVGAIKKTVIPYGILELDHKKLDLKKMEEKPSKKYLVNTGAYIINKKIIKLIPNYKKFNFNDLIDKIKLQKNLKIGVYPINEKNWIDLGTWKEYEKNITAID